MATQGTFSYDESAHLDPITGAPGFHPIGTGVGAAGGGLAGAAAGAAIGSVVPGIGTIIGGVVGTIAGAAGGGVAGHAIAENVDPSTEETYWRENYRTRPYVDEGADYTEYAPAYRYGWESGANNSDIPYDQAEPHLEKNWRDNEPKPKMEWARARYAVKDAWDRVAHGGARKLDKTQTAEPVVEEQLTREAPVTKDESPIEEVTLSKTSPDRTDTSATRFVKAMPTQSASTNPPMPTWPPAPTGPRTRRNLQTPVMNIQSTLPERPSSLSGTLFS
jgi:hypothetical protein